MTKSSGAKKILSSVFINLAGRVRNSLRLYRRLIRWLESIQRPTELAKQPLELTCSQISFSEPTTPSFKNQFFKTGLIPRESGISQTQNSLNRSGLSIPKSKDGGPGAGGLRSRAATLIFPNILLTVGWLTL